MRMKSEIDNTIDFYMHQILRHGRINAEEEIRLSKIIEEGGEAGDEARDEFVHANLRLVVYYAKQFRKWTDLDLADLIQEGNIGLLKALDKFDHTRGFKFSTYASWWIKQAMMRAIQHNEMIRIPVHQIERRDKIARAVKEMSRAFGRDPTDEEISDYLEMPMKYVRQVRALPEVNVSLDASVATEGEQNNTLVDVLADPDMLDPEEITMKIDISDKLHERLGELLPPREYRIFCLRYGLNDEEPHSLEAIGQKVGLTRERVRQIIRRWHKKLEDKLREDLPEG
jgi:RNA polymerase primary sigma factor